MGADSVGFQVGVGFDLGKWVGFCGFGGYGEVNSTAAVSWVMQVSVDFSDFGEIPGGRLEGVDVWNKWNRNQDYLYRTIFFLFAVLE